MRATQSIIVVHILKIQGPLKVRGGAGVAILSFWDLLLIQDIKKVPIAKFSPPPLFIVQNINVSPGKMYHCGLF